MRNNFFMLTNLENFLLEVIGLYSIVDVYDEILGSSKSCSCPCQLALGLL